MTKEVKIKTCFIGLGLSVLTGIGLFLPAPAISLPPSASIVVAQVPPVERKRVAVLDFDCKYQQYGLLLRLAGNWTS